MINNIKQFVFPYINSNMYIALENRSALVIDPHYSEEAEKYLKENKVSEALILLSHEHFDHTVGVNWFRENFEVHLVCQKNAMLPKSQKYSNRPTPVTIILLDKGMNAEAEAFEKQYQPYTYTAEETFDNELDLVWREHKIHMESIPGHSPASCLITFDDSVCFTGDSLIPDTEATTRWPGSSTEAYYRDTLPKLKSIPTSAVIFPGHGSPVEMSRLRYMDNKFVVV